jgi:hypothetical protein
MPNCVWIWETSKLSLVATVMQLEGVRALHWHPSASRLAICAGNSKLYLWSEEGCSIVAVPIRMFFFFHFFTFQFISHFDSVLYFQLE